MAFGEIWHDERFEFSDGDTGRKFFIIVSNTSNPHIAIKVTSRARRYPSVAVGCNEKRLVYLVPVGTQAEFKKPSYLQLHEYFELAASKMLQDQFNKKIEHKGELTQHHKTHLKGCLKKCKDDIEEEFHKLIF